MAGSTPDPDNAGQRRRRKTQKGHEARPPDPVDSRDGASAVVGGPTAPEAIDPVDGTQRQEIAENAYYRSQKRGFAPGQEEQDWLEAEAEVKSRRPKRR